MHPCDCTKLTGECAHDCPDCGGEGISAKRHLYSINVEPASFAFVIAWSEEQAREIARAPDKEYQPLTGVDPAPDGVPAGFVGVIGGISEGEPFEVPRP